MISLKIWLTRLVESGYLPADDADLRLKKLVLAMVPLIIGPAAFIWGTIYFLLGHPLSGSIPMFYAIVSAASLVYFFRTKKTRFIQDSQLLLVLLLPFMLMWSLGGFAAGSMVMLWAIFAPVAAVLFLEKRDAFLWFLAYFVLVLLSVLIDDYAAAATPALPERARHIFYLLNISCVSAGLFLLVSSSINEEKRIIRSNLRLSATAFESREGIMITDANNVIMRVNRAFSEITGFSPEDVMGKTPNLMKSDRHDAAFYAAMWEGIERTGAWQGEVWNRRKNGEVYPAWLIITAVKDDEGLTTHYVGTSTDDTERRKAEDEIRNLAFHDSLTGLPNRRLLLDRLNQALASSARSGKCGALLFIDLDNFKTLNDTLGHDIGDLLLQQVAQRLVTCVREGDTVARLGGDEFVVMLEDLSGNLQEAATQTEIVGEKILAALNETYELGNYKHHSTPSIGVTLFVDHQETIDELLKRADLAMYQAKAAGRNTLRFFDPDMQTLVTARATMEIDLRRAIVEKQFLVHYQAQVDSCGRVIGAEALVRWQHPERGLVSPADFIPLAEESGLILPIGHWVLEAACGKLAVWAAKPEMAHLTVAVNVSARQFSLPNFVEQVLAVVDYLGVRPDRLKLELTESLLLENAEDIIAKMLALRARGVGFSMDDFGTGYSSLSYLKRLPLDQLKIDQSFVRDVLTDSNDAAIARTVVALGQSLGLAVIAEGVETEAQREFLEAHGCHAYQGYLFSRPLPVEGFEEFAQRI